MIILTNCLTDTADEGSLKVASSLVKRIKKSRTDVELISYGAEHPLNDHHLKVNRLMLSGRLFKLIRGRKDAVWFLPFPSRLIATAIRTFVVSLYARGRLRVLLPMRSEQVGCAEKLLLRLSGAKIVVLSEELQRDYAKIFGSRVKYIKAGVDTKKYVPVDAEEKARLREKYGIPKDKQVLLHVGHLKEGRNIGTLLSLDDRFHVVLVVSTLFEHEQDMDLRKRLSDRKQLTLIDRYIPDIQEIYQLSDVYYFPVLDEKHCISAPLSVLEGAACNLPIVCTRFAELKQLEGKEGFCFIDSFEPEPLQALIDRAIKAGRGGRAGVLEYDWEQAAKNIAAIDEQG